MARSNRLSLGEVKQALRLVGECRDLGHDPVAWLRHAIVASQHLLRARVGAGVITVPTGFEFLRPEDLFLYTGFEPDEYRRALEYMFARKHLRESEFQHFQAVRTPNITLRPVTLITRRVFQMGESHAVRASLGIEDFMFSQRQSVGGRATLVLSPQRAYRDRYFTARDSRLLRLFHDELALLVGTVLSDGRADPLSDLPPRLRQTLDALLRGDSEKEAARRLGLSRHTVHDYVTALYRRFEVNSRAELLALCLRRRIQPTTLPES